jgi:flagellar motor switch protein FliM
MRERTRKLREGLSKVEFCMLLKFGSIRVRRFEGQEDLVKGLLDTFAKFKQEEAREFNVYLPNMRRTSRWKRTAKHGRRLLLRMSLRTSTLSAASIMILKMKRLSVSLMRFIFICPGWVHKPS